MVQGQGGRFAAEFARLARACGARTSSSPSPTEPSQTVPSSSARSWGDERGEYGERDGYGYGYARAASAWCADPYADALRAGRGPLFLRRTDGWLLPLEVERWCAQADAADLSVLRRCEGAVLDVGCGPGRLVAALAARGRRCSAST